MWELKVEKLNCTCYNKDHQLDTRVDHYNGQLDDAKLCEWNHFLRVTIDHDQMRQVDRDKP